jgi:hypothetical protein
LPPRFEEAMHRRLGQTGIFVEVNGKYYLNEERLRQIQEQRAKGGYGGDRGGGWGGAGPPTWTRVAGILLMLPMGIIVAFVLFYFFAFNGGVFPGEFLIILLVIMLALFVARLLFWRSRRRYWRDQWKGREAKERVDFMRLVRQLNQTYAQTFLIVTHDHKEELAKRPLMQTQKFF